MEYTYTASARLHLEQKLGEKTSGLKAVDILTDPGPELNRAVYVNANGTPTEMATRITTLAFVNGIMVNIRHAAQKGWWKESEHMQYVIDNLQSLYVENGEATEGIWDEKIKPTAKGVNDPLPKFTRVGPDEMGFLAAMLRDMYPTDHSFVLLSSKFNDAKAVTSYISNTNRHDVIILLRQMADLIEAELKK